MMHLVNKSQVRILDFDIETRPLSWYAMDLTTREITAIACQFVGENETHCFALGEMKLATILKRFVNLYDQADLVTGHYIRGYDLPNINGQLAELDMPMLKPKLTHDTKLDLVKMQGLSKSQENLGAMLGLDHPKISMSQADWREANRLTKRGVALTKQRVVGDVHQHIEMRERLLALGLLGPPKLWNGGAGKTAKYAA